eukprot:1324414-Amorphochlora_amoeboformis.AAC.3
MHPTFSTLQQMQRETGTWIRIRGRGSMRDKQEEARIRNKPGHEHLLEPLHVLIEANQLPGAVDAVLAAAEAKVKALLIPVEESKDVHKKEQLRQLAQMRGEEQKGGGQGAYDPYAASMQYYYPYHQYYSQYYANYGQDQAGAGGAAAASLGGMGAPGGIGGLGGAASGAGGGLEATKHTAPGQPPASGGEDPGKLEALQAERKELTILAPGRLTLTTRLLDSEIN